MPQISSGDLVSRVNQVNRRTIAHTGQNRIRNVFIVAEVAGSFALLAFAGLFVRSAQKGARVNLGFDSNRTLLMSMDTRMIGFDQAHSEILYRDIKRRILDLPGVSRAGYAYATPLGYYQGSNLRSRRAFGRQAEPADDSTEHRR